MKEPFDALPLNSQGRQGYSDQTLDWQTRSLGFDEGKKCDQSAGCNPKIDGKGAKGSERALFNKREKNTEGDGQLEKGR